MTEKEILKEAKLELDKNTLEMMKDVIREANSDREGLDNIKHVIKRLAVHQVVLEKRASKTNKWLKWLSIVMAIGAFFSILTFFK